MFRYREEIALEEKTKNDKIKAIQNQTNEVKKKHSELLREYQTLERTHFQLNNEKENLKHSFDEANQTISQLKTNHDRRWHWLNLTDIASRLADILSS